MGCSSSMPASPTTKKKMKIPSSYNHPPHLVSSSYGILNLEDLDLPPTYPLSSQSVEQSPPSHLMHHDVLSTLNTLENKAVDSGPQSWFEVSNMLQNFKPSIDASNLTPGKSLSHVDSVDVNDIMRDLDEDSSANGPKPYPRKQSGMPIHTLEELDGRQVGKESQKGLVKRANPKGVIDSRTGFKAPLKEDKVSAVEPSSNGDEERKVILQESNTNSSATITTSLLFDSDFLGSYKQTLGNLSEDDWKAVNASEPVSTQKPVEDIQQGLNGHTKSSLEKSIGTQDVQKKPISSSLESKAVPTAAPEKINATQIQIGSSLEDFETICPPDGGDGIVLYTTSLKKIKKTYEDSMKVKNILLSYGSAIDERDVSVSLQYRNELWELMQKVVSVPRLFIRGRYIGGTQEIVDLYEQGKLGNLIQGLPVN